MKLRVYILLQTLFLLSYLAADAQIWVKGGLGVSDITFKKEGQIPFLGYEINSLEHKLPLLTYQLGVLTTFELTDHFDCQPELVLVAQGLYYSTKYLYDDITYKIRSNYVQVPLLIKYNTAIKKIKRSGIIIGPYAALKLNATKITEIDGQREKSKMANVEQTDFGIIGGYVFDFNLNKRKILIDLRTSYSLFNMMDTIDGYIPLHIDPEIAYARNVSVNLSVLYQFDIINPKND